MVCWKFCYQGYINKVAQNEKLSKIYSNSAPLGGTLSTRETRLFPLFDLCSYQLVQPAMADHATRKTTTNRLEEAISHLSLAFTTLNSLARSIPSSTASTILPTPILLPFLALKSSNASWSEFL